MKTQKILVKTLLKTLEYYADHCVYNSIRSGRDCIFIDTGQRARNTLKLFKEFSEIKELDETNIYELEQAHKGFCDNIALPKDVKFIKIKENIK